VSFRLRVFLLVMLVAASAIGATGWLMLSLASREGDRSQLAAREHSQEIIAAVSRYGMVHGTWEGIASLVEQLSKKTSLHIRLVTHAAEVVVDTDNLHGIAGRPVTPNPLVVDPRPVPDPRILNASEPIALEMREPPTAISAATLFDMDGPAGASRSVLLTRQLAQYEAALAAMRCIATQDPHVDRGLPLTASPYLARAQIVNYPECVQQEATRVLDNRTGLQRQWFRFVKCFVEPARAGKVGVPVPQGDSLAPGEKDTYCLANVFIELSSDSSAVPLELYLGQDKQNDLGLLGRPAAAGFAGLLLMALTGTAVVARQVSRPVRRLTSAARRLAGGELDARVPVGGTGDLVELSRSFNSMAAAVQRSEQRQRQLVADVAHELRTPLSNLRGYLEGLQDGVVPPSPELFASLHEETLLQRRILDDLHMLALAEGGNLEYTRTRVNLAELAETAVTAHGAVAAEAGVTLRAETEVSGAWLVADADRLRQALSNLLGNAIRYTDPGGTVVVRASVTAAELQLEVQDSGAGIADEDLPHVFDRFWRADRARVRGTGGSGLGLTIAQRLVADHGGRIEVSSVLGAGTAFTMRFPRPAATR
jgi:two-component system sensor histidine kinase BaeS